MSEANHNDLVTSIYQIVNRPPLHSMVYDWGQLLVTHSAFYAYGWMPHPTGITYPIDPEHPERQEDQPKYMPNSDSITVAFVGPDDLPKAITDKAGDNADITRSYALFNGGQMNGLRIVAGSAIRSLDIMADGYIAKRADITETDLDEFYELLRAREGHSDRGYRVDTEELLKGFLLSSISGKINTIVQHALDNRSGQSRRQRILNKMSSSHYRKAYRVEKDVFDTFSVTSMNRELAMLTNPQVPYPKNHNIKSRY